MKISRPATIALNVYALLLAAFLMWPLLQVVLTSFTSDIVFPPRNWSLDRLPRSVVARIFPVSAL